MSTQLYQRIKDLLGDDAIEFDYALDGLQRKGWMKHFEVRAAVELAKAELIRMNDLNIRFFAGASPLMDPPPHDALTVFALPDLPSPLIAEFCRVGSAEAGYSSFLPDLRDVDGPLKELLALPHVAESMQERRKTPPWIRVRQALERIEQLVPFRVFFATDVTIEIKFSRAVDKNAAQQIEAIAEKVNPDIYQAYEGASIRKAIRVSGALKLWWD
jgi:hypothetical protein